MIGPLTLSVVLFNVEIQGYNKKIVEDYGRLVNNLLEREAVHFRVSPAVTNPSEALNMTYSLLPVDILDLDQVEQVMSVCVYLRVTWTVDYMTWDPAQYSNITSVTMDAKSLWTPKIMVVIGYLDQLNLDMQDSLIVNSNGNVHFHLPTYLRFRCMVDFKKYPFDTQVCNVGFSSYTDQNDNMTVNYKIETLDGANSYRTNGEWLMVNLSNEIAVDDNQIHYPKFTFKVRRRAAYYVITIIFPLILTSLMISMVFLIPTKTGEKISFFVSVYTSLTIFLSFISAVLPRNLSSAPYLVLLFIGVCVQGILANVATLLVVNKYVTEHSKTKNSNKVKLARGNVNIGTFKLNHKEESNNPPEVEETSEQLAEQTSSRTCCLSSAKWDKVFFVLFSMTELVLLFSLFQFTDWLSEADSIYF